MLLLLFATPLSANIINIPADFATITEGINASTNGDTILVNNGTYTENINFNGKNILLTSQYSNSADTTDIIQTIINGNNVASVVTFENGESNTAILSGFTIMNGSASRGGGIFCKDASSPSLTNLIIKENEATLYGGGIYCFTQSDAKIENVKLINNSASSRGGAIYAGNSNPLIKNSIISDNTCNAYGGGIYAFNSAFVLQNSTMSNNSASFSGGSIYCKSGSDPILINSIIWNNSPQEISFSSSGEPDSLIAVRCNIQGGEIMVENGESGFLDFSNNNINTDPRFQNMIGTDFNLSNESPCIGAGAISVEINGIVYNSPANDIYGNTRPDPISSNPDIGAVEQPRGFPLVLAPENLSTVAANKMITLSWTGNTENYLHKYKIYRDTVSPATTLIDSIIASPGIDTSYTDSILTNGQTYYYRITAIDTTGDESQFSNEVSDIPYDNQAPDSPQGLTVTDSVQAINLKWNSNPESDLVYYNIYKSDLTGVWADSVYFIGKIYAPDTTLIDSSIQHGTKYFYTITAVDTAGNESIESNEFSVSAIFIEVTNVNFAQRTDGSTLIDIYYTFTGHDTTHYTVIPHVQPDTTSGWTELTIISGDVGNNVLPGTNKHLIWNLGSEMNDIFSEQAKMKITVTTND